MDDPTPHAPERRSSLRSSGATWGGPLAVGLTLGVILAAITASLVAAWGAAAWIPALVAVATCAVLARRAAHAGDHTRALRWASYAIGLAASPAALMIVFLVLRAGVVSAPW